MGEVTHESSALTTKNGSSPLSRVFLFTGTSESSFPQPNQPGSLSRWVNNLVQKPCFVSSIDSVASQFTEAPYLSHCLRCSSGPISDSPPVSPTSLVFVPLFPR